MCVHETHPLRRHERIQCFLSQEHPVRLSTQICEPNPCNRIIVRMEYQGPNLKDALPNLDVRLAALKPSSVLDEWFPS